MSALIAASLFLTSTLVAVDAPEKKDLADLQGVWQVVSLEVNGKARELPGHKHIWVIKDRKVEYGGKELAEMTIDGATTPKSIDLHFRAPESENEGVYKVEKDRLTICINLRADAVKERPQEFSTEGKPDYRLLVFERSKTGDALEGLGGYVGVVLRLVPDTREVMVTDTIKDSPAEKMGLKKDDIVLQVGGEAAKELQPTVKMIQRVKPGTDLVLRIKRDGKEQDVTIRTGVVPFHFLLI